ncbi:MAG: 16S rRNA (guanine(966)-N(2))-methyltransferase RsmD [Parachlamydiaceae bacterium]
MHIFSGLYKNRKISSPKGEKTRPTSGRLREALFNICQGEIENANFLDLFAGSGAMGLEALSRGAGWATFVDNSKESIRCIQTNIRALEVEKSTQVIYGDVFSTLKYFAKQGKNSKVFDLIYADPPYESFIDDSLEKIAFSAQIVSLIDTLIEAGCSPLSANGSLFIEDAVKVISNEQEPYKNLTLRSTRTMGRSALQHWIRS